MYMLINLTQTCDVPIQVGSFDVYLQNDINEVPFFDVNLPREIALRIFSHLGINDLCSCAQVCVLMKLLDQTS